ncbi:MAG: hypothetical protein PHU47_01075 [Candidatus ainarchaeum sp.]|nr:hypothetical protein [Candidatus ainarchaeum sp.]
MGILTVGKKCTIMKGKNFGKKVTIEKLDSKFVYYKLNNKDEKIGILQVFPLE